LNGFMIVDLSIRVDILFFVPCEVRKFICPNFYGLLYRLFFFGEFLWS